MKSKLLSRTKKKLAASEGIGTENKDQAAVQITNLTTGESFIGRLAITGNSQLYLPVEIQEMLKGSERIRIQILGG